MKKEEGVHATDIAKRKKPKMQKVTIGIEVENEKGGIVIGCVKGEWLATLSSKEILEMVKEAINEIE
ncbi:unnamed protein product [marine sediment metagenome]|uniref:Uncharacterized protein n=1 Tax=marine sediment metagenome TaxID=412755 RepID=X1EXP4_9ZZZZ